MADDWDRLGLLVRERRLALGYTSREAFQKAAKGAGKNISARRLGDLERGTPVGSAFLLQVEPMLGWITGSHLDVLAGSEPRLRPVMREAESDGVTTRTADSDLADETVQIASPAVREHPRLQRADIRTALTRFYAARRSLDQGIQAIEDYVESVDDH